MNEKQFKMPVNALLFMNYLLKPFEFILLKCAEMQYQLLDIFMIYVPLVDLTLTDLLT